MREIDERVWRMVTRDGFAREFWAELRRRRAVRQTTSRREVFDFLNGLFLAEFGSRHMTRSGIRGNFGDKTRLW